MHSQGLQQLQLQQLHPTAQELLKQAVSEFTVHHVQEPGWLFCRSPIYPPPPQSVPLPGFPYSSTSWVFVLAAAFIALQLSASLLIVRCRRCLLSFHYEENADSFSAASYVVEWFIPPPPPPPPPPHAAEGIDRSQARNGRLCRVVVTDFGEFAGTGYHYKGPRSSRVRRNSLIGCT